MTEIVFISKRGDYSRLVEMARLEKQALFDLRYSPNTIMGKTKVDALDRGRSKLEIVSPQFVNIEVGKAEDSAAIKIYNGYRPPHLDYTKSIRIPVYGDYETYSSRWWYTTCRYSGYIKSEHDWGYSPALFFAYETYPEYHFLPLPNLDFVVEVAHPKVWARVYTYDFATEGPIKHNNTIKFDVDLYNFSEDAYAVFQVIGTYALDNIKLPYLNNSNNLLITNLINIKDTSINENNCLPAMNILSIADIGMLYINQNNIDDYELITYAGEDRPPALQKERLSITVKFPSMYDINDTNRVFISRFGTINNLYYFFYTVFVKAGNMDEGRDKLYSLVDTLYNNGNNTIGVEADSINLVGVYYRCNYFEVGDDFIFMRNTDSPYTIGGVIPFMPAFGSDYYVPETYANITPKQWLGEDLSDYVKVGTIDKMPAMMYYNLEKREPQDIEGLCTHYWEPVSYITNGFINIRLAHDEDEPELFVYNTIPMVGDTLPGEFGWLFDRIILADSNLRIYPNSPHYPEWDLRVRPGRGLSVFRYDPDAGCFYFAKDEDPDWVMEICNNSWCSPCTYYDYKGCIPEGDCNIGCFGGVCCSLFCEDPSGNIIQYYDRYSYKFNILRSFPDTAAPVLVCNWFSGCHALSGPQRSTDSIWYNSNVVELYPEDITKSRPVACEVIPYRPKLGKSAIASGTEFYLPFNYVNDRHHPAIGFVSPTVRITIDNPFRYAAYCESVGGDF